MFDLVSDHFDVEIKHDSDLKQIKEELLTKHKI